MIRHKNSHFILVSHARDELVTSDCRVLCSTHWGGTRIQTGFGGFSRVRLINNDNDKK